MAHEGRGQRRALVGARDGRAARALLLHLSALDAGRWRSLNGDIGAMEFYSAHWDAAGKRWIGGAQDDDVQVAPERCSASDVLKRVAAAVLRGRRTTAGRGWGCEHTSAVKLVTLDPDRSPL